MQKYLWGGAALLVAGAAFTFVTVDYAWRHPDSVIARACGTLGSAAVNANPLTIMNRNTAGSDVACEGEVAQVNLSKPILGGEETLEPIQVDSVPAPTAEPPYGTEESESPWDVRGLFDRAIEDVGDESFVPMPYADETVNGEQSERCITNQCLPVSFWSGLTPAGTFTPDLNNAGEECEMQPPVSWIKTILRMIREAISPVEDEMPVEDMPVVPDEENAEEQSEEQPVPPPSYHHHYHEQGCPYMGGCYCPPVQSPVRIPAEEQSPVRTITKPTGEGRSFWDKLLNRVSERRWYLPFIDTMEFRPSDAGPNCMPNERPF